MTSVEAESCEENLLLCRSGSYPYHADVKCLCRIFVYLKINLEQDALVLGPLEIALTIIMKLFNNIPDVSTKSLSFDGLS